MGIDYDGGMIVGRKASGLDIPDTDEMDAWEWLEENDIDKMSPYYDAKLEDCILGFEVSDVLVSDMDTWLVEVQDLAKRFKAIFGVEAMLIGTQNIW